MAIKAHHAFGARSYAYTVTVVSFKNYVSGPGRDHDQLLLQLGLSHKREACDANQNNLPI